MHPTNMKQEVGYLFLHEKIIELGDQNHMLLQEGGDVPLWMTPQDHVATYFSQYDGPQLKDNKKSELIGNIKGSGVDIPVVKGETVSDMQDISRKKICSKYNKEGKGEGIYG